MNKAAYEKLLKEILVQVVNNSSFTESRKYIQHGNTSIYRHSIMVARKSCQIASKYNIKVSYREMVRGALLHDYFLYDWHDKSHNHKRPHGFFHAGAALKNAMRDFELTDIEKDIIKKHMFPLTPVPPKYIESFIVCLADKVCSAGETFIKNR
ncbi:MAG: HD domain-containing protein [Lachnospiraceae bacterium]